MTPHPIPVGQRGFQNFHRRLFSPLRQFGTVQDQGQALTRYGPIRTNSKTGLFFHSSRVWCLLFGTYDGSLGSRCQRILVRVSWRCDLELYLGLVRDSAWWIDVSRGRNLLQMWIPFTGFVAVATRGITVTWRSYMIPSYIVL